MKLLERKDSSSHKASVSIAMKHVGFDHFILCSNILLLPFQASVIVTVYQLIYWSSTPLQSLVDAHSLGYKGTCTNVCTTDLSLHLL